jgi:hypothetical protein
MHADSHASNHVGWNRKPELILGCHCMAGKLALLKDMFHGRVALIAVRLLHRFGLQHRNVTFDCHLLVVIAVQEHVTSLLNY